jgi:DNA-binding MarR family transcriptional regulator
MARENPPELQVEDWLATVGMEVLCQWDVLVFLYRHQTSLVSAEQIARLLGYATSAVGATLDNLESLGLVERSRAAQGVRLYQFTAPTDPPRGDALDQLMTCTDSRAVRLLLAKKLRPEDRPDQNNGHSHLLAKGRATWLKAI